MKLSTETANAVLGTLKLRQRLPGYRLEMTASPVADFWSLRASTEPRRGESVSSIRGRWRSYAIEITGCELARKAYNNSALIGLLIDHVDYLAAVLLGQRPAGKWRKFGRRALA